MPEIAVQERHADDAAIVEAVAGPRDQRQRELQVQLLAPAVQPLAKGRQPVQQRAPVRTVGKVQTAGKLQVAAKKRLALPFQRLQLLPGSWFAGRQRSQLREPRLKLLEPAAQLAGRVYRRRAIRLQQMGNTLGLPPELRHAGCPDVAGVHGPFSPSSTGAGKGTPGRTRISPSQ